MKEKIQEPQYFEEGEDYGFCNEPAYGYGPLDAFDACYELAGQTFPVVIQGFVKEDAAPSNDFRYRVTYENGDKRILEYVLGTGFIEEGGTQTDHARKVAACINNHFSKG